MSFKSASGKLSGSIPVKSGAHPVNRQTRPVVTLNLREVLLQALKSPHDQRLNSEIGSIRGGGEPEIRIGCSITSIDQPFMLNGMDGSSKTRMLIERLQLAYPVLQPSARIRFLSL